MKKLLILIYVFLLSFGSYAQKNYTRMADSEMKRNPEAWMLDFSKAPKWNYCHGLVSQSILQTYDKTGERKYYAYIYDYVDTMINESGDILGYKPQEYNI
ncbi:glycosyl hydrolase family 88, partial [Sphingobacterium olei]